MTVTMQEDGEITLTLVGYDEDSQDENLIFEIVDSPANGTLYTGRASSTYTYAPYNDYNGDDQFTFRVSDGVSYSEPGIVSITVTPVNEAPIIMDISVQETLEDIPIIIPVGIINIEEDPLVVEIVNESQNGVSFVDDRIVHYSPNYGFSGNDNLVIQVRETGSDSLISNQMSIAIIITAVNDAPVAESFEVDLVENVGMSLTLVGYDEDTDDENLVFEIVDPPSHGTLTSNRIIAEYIYTPETNYNGQDSFTYQVFDGELYSSLGVVSIFIDSVNTAPVILDVSDQITDEDITLGVDIVVNDGENDSLSIDIVGDPLHGSVDSITTSDGINFIVYYTPESGFNGLDNFVIQAIEVESGLSSDQINISVTVVVIINSH